MKTAVMKRHALLEKFANASGVSGREERIRELFIESIEPHVDEIDVDSMGNVIGTKHGSNPDAPSILLGGHMDEIGFVVHYIDERGYIRFTTRGGFDPKTLVAQKVVVCGLDGRDLLGVIGSKAIHLMDANERNRNVTIGDLFIDLGLPAKKVKELVKIGAPVTLYQPLQRVGDLYTGKSLDNRMSLFVIAKALQGLRKGSDSTVYAVGTVQEEVGLRGAQAVANTLKPDIAIAIDVTHGCNIPGIGADKCIAQLGSGAAIGVQDGSVISNPQLVGALEALANEWNIKHQLVVKGAGGTDGGAFQRSGGAVATATLGIPLRYMHSVVETIDPKDLDALVDLTTRLVRQAPEFDLAY